MFNTDNVHPCLAVRHPVVSMVNKRQICAANSVLSTKIRVISVQRA